MSAIVPFTFENTAVRVTDRSGDPWFILADVCRVLEHSNPTVAASRLDDDEKMTLNITEGHSGQRGGAQSQTIINESGLYSLILTSRKPAAKRFKKWVTSEVLPTLRKTGCYAMPGAEAPPSPPPSALDLETAREWIGLAREAGEIAGPDAARTVLERSPLFLPIGTTRPPPPQPDQSHASPKSKAAPEPATRERRPQQSDSATLERRRQVDTVLARFLKENTTPKPGARVSATQLHEAYTRWCLEQRIEPLSGKAFGSACRRHEVRWIKSCGVNYYIGIRL